MDTGEGIISGVRYTAEKLGLNEIPVEKIKTFVGPPLRESFKEHYRLSDARADEAAAVFRERYKSVDMFKSKPYDGIYGLLEKLKKAGALIALATFKRHEYTLELMDYFNFTSYFNFIHGSDDLEKKTKLDIVNMCIKDSGIRNLSDAVLVGDTHFDAAGADQAEIRFIGVSYGFGFRTEADISIYPNIGLAHNVNQLEAFLMAQATF